MQDFYLPHFWGRGGRRGSQQWWQQDLAHPVTEPNVYAKFHPCQFSSFCGKRAEVDNKMKNLQIELFKFLKKPLRSVSHFQPHTYFGRSNKYLFVKFDPCQNSNQNLDFSNINH